MTNSQMSDLGAVAILLIAGLLFGLIDRRNFRWRWLLAGLGLVALNNVLLAGFYGLVPDLVGGERNWTGKALALVGTLIVASLAAFGWRRVGLTLTQRSGSLRASLPVVLLYCAFFVGLALAFPSGESTKEDIAFQLTMPGLEEEPFYRGVLLFAFDQAFRGRIRLLGVDWGFGAVLSSIAFGVTHAFGYSDGAYTFEPVYMALTALPAFIAIWLRYRTGSLVLPVFLHNFGNAIGLLV